VSVAQYNSQGGSVPNWEAGMGVHYYLQEKAGHVYLRRVTFQGGKPDDRIVGNVEVLVAIHDFFESRGIRLTVRNVRKILEQVLEGSCPKPKRRVEGRSPQPRILAGPGGFEPPTTGLGEQQAITGSGSSERGNSQNSMELGPTADWEIQAWLGWCRQRASEKTCRSYASYLRKPLKLGNRWSVKAYRLYLQWKGKEIPGELRVKAGRPDLRVPSEDEIRLTLFRACQLDNRLCLVYQLLLESGARLAEIVKMLRGYKPELDKPQDGYYEYQLNWHRGKKHAFVIFHVTRPGLEFGNTESWVTHQAMKHGLVRPKHMRKFVATRMLELEIPRDAVNFVQGRVSEDVLATHYLDRLVLARRYYPRYAEWLRQLYEELGLARG